MVVDFLYALRNRKSKQVVRGTKCKGGTYYKRKNDCAIRCRDMNMHNRNVDYEVGKYMVIDVTDEEEFKED